MTLVSSRCVLDFPSAESRREFHLAKLSQATQLDRIGDGMVAPGNCVETAVFVSFFMATIQVSDVS